MKFADKYPTILLYPASTSMRRVLLGFNTSIPVNPLWDRLTRSRRGWRKNQPGIGPVSELRLRSTFFS
ncbi:hypothetical protein HanIR_Chr10g0481931 [Helianthus annuus]|nr:hypothetical protein HanIR_Chr10g0481931 [Helianthus annuus]